MDGNAVALQDRDRVLLSELAVLRIADRDQLMRLGGFTSVGRVNRRLLQLLRAGMLRRGFIATPGGGSKALYSVSRRGAAACGSEFKAFGFRADSLLASHALQHQLLVNEVHTMLKSTSLPLPGYRFRLWQSLSEKLASTIELIPDGYFEIDTPKGPRAAFVEVDCGTEALRVWKKKAEQYLRLATSGTFQQHFGNKPFLVLIVCLTEPRLNSIAGELVKQGTGFFRLAILQDIKQEGLWSAVWRKPDAEQKLSLIERQL